ncbi:MAG: UDP-N-acetylglucosamine 2-epimerase (non-hydrolyzing) [Microbacteriaceae bacterium]|nr:MAG: UDP-N-acetylglucosamine 2-epimerase (non-hydrolyzing) [Microbacteriaceae bacterium]
MKVLSVVGARPQFVKLSPVHRALQAAGHDHVIVHTGQHYAPELSSGLFADLEIPEPDTNLGIGSASHAVQTGSMIIGLESVFEDAHPDWVLVYGDTNSTIAASLTAVKMHLPIAHLEAGLRSGNRVMPEEHNRVVTDHLADLLLAPTTTAMRHLAAEGLAKRSKNVGDVMTDVCYRVRDFVASHPPTMPDAWTPAPNMVLATIHRAENTDDPSRLEFILNGLNHLGLPVLLVAHPRLVARSTTFGLPLSRDAVTPIASMNYTQMINALAHARGVVTDSGGLQKEAYLMRTACITVRTETEWPETLSDNWNVVDPNLQVDVAKHFSRDRAVRTSTPFGDGHAAVRVTHALEHCHARADERVRYFT